MRYLQLLIGKLIRGVGRILRKGGLTRGVKCRRHYGRGSWGCRYIQAHDHMFFEWLVQLPFSFDSSFLLLLSLFFSLLSLLFSFFLVEGGGAAYAPAYWVKSRWFNSLIKIKIFIIEILLYLILIYLFGWNTIQIVWQKLFFYKTWFKLNPEFWTPHNIKKISMFGINSINSFVMNNGGIYWGWKLRLWKDINHK